MDKTQTFEAWDLPWFDTMEGWDIAHIESVASHPDLPAAWWGSSDHGTHTMWLYAAITDNDIGIASLPYNKVWVHSISPTAANHISAFGKLQDIIDDGAEYILIAQLWGFFMRDSAEALLWEYFVLANSDVTFIAAASNENLNPDTDDAIPSWSQYCCWDITWAAAWTWHIYPMWVSAPNMIAVWATDQWDGKVSFSSYGDWVDISAPWRDLLSTNNDGGYEQKSGTSMSASLAAWLIALVGDADLVRNTGDPVVWSMWPRINTCKAVASYLWVSDDSCSTGTWSSICGNWIIEAGEQCDDGNIINGDGCESDCTLTSVSVCGNWIAEAWEECGEPALSACTSTKFKPMFCNSLTCVCEWPAVAQVDIIKEEPWETTTPTTGPGPTTWPGPTTTPTTITWPTTGPSTWGEYPTKKTEYPLPWRK